MVGTARFTAVYFHSFAVYNFQQRKVRRQYPVHNSMTCIQCGETSKYKCPTCRQPYCSVACYKEHNTNPCTKPPDPPRDLDSIDEPKTEYDYPTEDTVPLEKLKLLQESAELKKGLQDPCVREILETLDKAYNPDSLIQEYMQEPVFTEFVEACLKVVQSQEGDTT